MNGEGGYLDKPCQIDPDLFVALDRAADRASRSVACALERERQWQESPLQSANHRRGNK